MTTQTQAFQAKTQLKNTIRTKRFTTLQNYNFFRFKKEKISFAKHKETYFRLNNIIVSIFHNTIENSNLLETVKVVEKSIHKVLFPVVNRKTGYVTGREKQQNRINTLKSKLVLLNSSITKLDIAWYLDSISFLLFGIDTDYSYDCKKMSLSELNAIKKKYLCEIVKACL